MSLPPYQQIKDHRTWQHCLSRLQAEPRLAIDLEANSLYAYQEKVCLIQISVPGDDFIVDPTVGLELSGLQELIQNPAVEKVFHAAEYDLMLLKRQYGWTLSNLFDTMWAARILGHTRVGLASLLEEFFGVRQNKKYQKANWCRRPLPPAQLIYAQLDTHYLLALREALAEQLKEAECLEEAREIFAEQTQITLPDTDFDPDGFWSINGIRGLKRQQLAILRALYIYRDEQARRQDRPHFKIFGDKTLLELAGTEPRQLEDLPEVHGMTRGQVRRYGRQLLKIIQEARQAPPPRKPRSKNNNRPPDSVNRRYERLHTWRKERAQARGVESDVIVSRDALWALAWANPKTESELAGIPGLGPWRQQTYGQELLRLLRRK